MKIIGSYISPYVRKVLVCLDIKGIAYEIDPLIPYFGGEEFSRLIPSSGRFRRHTSTASSTTQPL